MPFGMVGQTGPWIRQILGFGDRSTGRGNFGGKCGVLHCYQWGLFTVRNSQCTAERLQLGEFLELQAHLAGDACRLSGVGVSSGRSNAALLPRDCGPSCFDVPLCIDICTASLRE